MDVLLFFFSSTRERKKMYSVYENVFLEVQLHLFCAR